MTTYNITLLLALSMIHNVLAFMNLNEFHSIIVGMKTTRRGAPPSLQLAGVSVFHEKLQTEISTGRLQRCTLSYKNLDDDEEQQQQQRENIVSPPESSPTPTQRIIQDIKNSMNSNGYDVLIEEDLTGWTSATGSHPNNYQKLNAVNANPYPTEVNVIDLPKTAFRTTFNKVKKTVSSSPSFKPLQEEEEDDDNMQVMLSLEMYIGRIAMLVSFYLAMEMILTGSSVLDKIQTL